MSPIIQAPNADEYVPYYASYIRRVPHGDIFAILSDQMPLLQDTLRDLSDSQALYRFAPDAWSIKEVVGHLCDVERIFAYRAFVIARNDPTPLSSFEQDDYVQEAHYDARPFGDIIQELSLLRQSTVLTFQALAPDISMRCGMANGSTISVRALLYILAGHLDHHLESLQTDYLTPMEAQHQSS